MRILVTGVGGQLGHDVMNELAKRGIEGIGSDIAPQYSGVQDGTPVTTMSYVSLDITDKDAVDRVISDVQAGYTTEVIPVTTEKYGISKAARPFNSRLDRSKLVENGFEPLPTWEDALKRYLDEIAN
ncbi:MAG: sugar nucleotide-binding protein [Eubacterium sp.]|nr:sugar nucleotide-binding protein [Eubacterium sp.]